MFWCLLRIPSPFCCYIILIVIFISINRLKLLYTSQTPKPLPSLLFFQQTQRSNPFISKIYWLVRSLLHVIWYTPFSLFPYIFAVFIPNSNPYIVVPEIIPSKRTEPYEFWWTDDLFKTENSLCVGNMSLSLLFIIWIKVYGYFTKSCWNLIRMKFEPLSCWIIGGWMLQWGKHLKALSVFPESKYRFATFRYLIYLYFGCINHNCERFDQSIVLKGWTTGYRVYRLIKDSGEWLWKLWIKFRGCMSKFCLQPLNWKQLSFGTGYPPV